MHGETLFSIANSDVVYVCIHVHEIYRPLIYFTKVVYGIIV